MPRRKKERGRPSRPYPPKIDAMPEEIARVVLHAKPKRKFFDPPAVEQYHCTGCDRLVNYPETLYNDRRCPECHSTATEPSLFDNRIE